MRRGVSILLIITLTFMLISLPALAANPVQRVTVDVYPLTPNTAAQYTIGFITSSTGALTGGVDEIIITFPEGTVLPSSIGSGKVTVNGVSVSSSGLDTDDNDLYIDLPKNVNVPAGGYVGIIISESAGIKTPARAGSQYLYVATSKDTATKSNAYNLEGTRISNLEIELSPGTIDEYAAYEINFTTSSQGALEGGEDYIYLEFAEEVSLPSSISRSYITVNGKAADDVDVDRSNNIVTVQLPSSVDIAKSANVRVKISASARIRNPEDSGDYALKVYTSKDAYYRSVEYSVGATISTPVVQVSPRKANTTAQYSLGFTTSEDGALKAGQDYIYLYFPEGTYIPSSIPRTYITVNGHEAGAVSIDKSNLRIGIRVPNGLTIGDKAYVGVVVQSKAGIRNPAKSGDYRLAVSTTADKSKVNSNEYTITGGTSGGDSDDEETGIPTVALTNNRAGAASQYLIHMKAGKDYDWEEDDVITLTFPQGTTLPSRIDGEDVIVVSEEADRVTVSGNTIKIYLNSDLTIEEDERIIILIPEFVGIKNPSAGGKYTLTVKFPGETTLRSQAYTIQESKKIVFRLGSTLYIDDGVLQTLEAAPTIINGRTMIPVRAVGNALGAETSYNGTNRTVTIRVGGKEILLFIDSTMAKVNNEWVSLDVAATIINGRTLVPVRFVSQHFGAEVEWDAATQEVIITR